MLAALLSVLALAGAPVSTRVECHPELPANIELGLTVSDEVQVVSGQVVTGRLDHVMLGPVACGAILYTSASTAERRQIRRLNPSVDFDRLVGVGLQVALHEATHVALNSPDECLVEKTTRAQINSLIASLGDPDRVAEEESAATVSDASLPAVYHGC